MIGDVIFTFIALVLGLVIGGLIIGGLARLSVPGPDPMPAWLTIGIGLGGSVLGGLVAYAFFGGPTGFPFGWAGAIVLVIIYRRIVQGRKVFGPEASERPTRGWGLRP